MKIKILFIFFILLVDICAQASEIFYTKGVVALKRNGKNYKAKKGVSLKTDDIVLTGKDSIAIIVYGGQSKIKLDPYSSLKIKDFYLDGKKKKKKSLVSLLRGNMLMDFKKNRQMKEVNIEVKYVAVGVRGTKFLVAASNKRDKNSYVAVKNGRVNVYNFEENDYESIRGGNAIVVEDGKKLTKPHKFKWMNQLDWDLSSTLTSSLFDSNELKLFRLKETSGLLDKLRLRKKRSISRSFQKKWNKIQGDSLKFKSPIKTIQKNINKRQKNIKKKVKSKTKDKINKRKDKLLNKAIDGLL